MIEPREFVPLCHWGYFSDILTNKRDILKGLVRYSGGFPKLLQPKGIRKKPLMGGRGVGGDKCEELSLEHFIDDSQNHFCKMPREDYGVMFSLGSRVHLVKSKNMFQI